MSKNGNPVSLIQTDIYFLQLHNHATSKNAMPNAIVYPIIFTTIPNTPLFVKFCPNCQQNNNHKSDHD